MTKAQQLVDKLLEADRPAAAPAAAAAVTGEDGGPPYHVSADVCGDDLSAGGSAQAWIRQAKTMFPNMRSRLGPNGCPEFTVQLGSLDQVQKLAALYGADSLYLEPGRRGTSVTFENAG